MQIYMKCPIPYSRVSELKVDISIYNILPSHIIIFNQTFDFLLFSCEKKQSRDEGGWTSRWAYASLNTKTM